VTSGGTELDRNEPFLTTTGRSRRTVRALAAAALFGLAAAATAQTAKDALEVTRQAVESQRRVLVSGALPLTDAEADAFWPLYDAYEKERRPLDERANKLVADFLAGAASLTDAQAKAMVEEALQVDEGRLRVRRSYLGRMLKAIPPRKAARFYQIDNKLDSVVQADVARQVPLAP
jgi:Spy/CpxP family protein refolding chaperone